MRLCALLGVHSRHALKQLLTHRDYQEWMELYREDPWDQDRADLRAGIVASAALAPYAKKGRQPKPVDFMPYVKTKAKQMSEESMKAIIKNVAPRWNAACNKLAKKG